MRMDWDFGVSKELSMVEEELRRSIRSEEPLLTDIASYVIGAGGKRIRPTVTLLSYKALGGTDIRKAVEISAAFELIHNATLLHDDINDGSSLRRGKIRAHKRYDMHSALVAGDFLFVKGFGLGGRFDKTVVEITANACSKLAEGEIKQKGNKWRLEVGEAEYLDTIKKKTAMPIEAGAMAGAYLADGTFEEIEILGEYGLNTGISFQIIDDVLDIVGDSKKMGKEPGADLREGNITMPIILALRELKGGERERLTQLLVKRDKDGKEVEEALGLLKTTRAVELSRRSALEFSEKAKRTLQSLGRNHCRDEMVRLADYTLSRDH